MGKNFLSREITAHWSLHSLIFQKSGILGVLLTALIKTYFILGLYLLGDIGIIRIDFAHCSMLRQHFYLAYCASSRIDYVTRGFSQSINGHIHSLITAHLPRMVIAHISEIIRFVSRIFALYTTQHARSLARTQPHIRSASAFSTVN